MFRKNVRLTLSDKMHREIGNDKIYHKMHRLNVSAIGTGSSIGNIYL